jgi:hypothetical protein
MFTSDNRRVNANNAADRFIDASFDCSMINPLSDRNIAHLSEPRRAAKEAEMPHFMRLTIANWFKVRNVY